MQRRHALPFGAEVLERGARHHEPIIYASAHARDAERVDLPPWSVVWEAGPPRLQAHLV